MLALRKRLRKSGYREGRKASATAQPLTDGQTDTIYSGSELQSTHGRPTRITDLDYISADCVPQPHMQMHMQYEAPVTTVHV